MSTPDAQAQARIDMLRLAGLALFGVFWGVPLAQALNLNSSRRVREWAQGDRPIPDGVLIDLRKLLDQQQLRMQAALNVFDQQGIISNQPNADGT